MGCAHGALTSSVVDPVASLSELPAGLASTLTCRVAGRVSAAAATAANIKAALAEVQATIAPVLVEVPRTAAPPDVPLPRLYDFIPQVWPSGASTPGECYVPIRNVGPALLGRVRLAMDVGRQTAVRGTTAERPASAMRLSRVRSTLPVGVRGIRSRKTISSGAL